LDGDDGVEIDTRICKGNMYSWVSPVVASSSSNALQTVKMDSIMAMADFPLKGVSDPVVVTSDSHISNIPQQVGRADEV